jgi:uncharacterized membrane protein YeaQ/YmgE (transglycosylase-associated protein family)
MRFLIVASLTVVGFFFGLLAGAVMPNEVLPPGIGPLLGLVAGLIGGILLARQTYPKRRS